MGENSLLETAGRLNDLVLEPMKQSFVGKDEVIDLLGVCLVARENLFILGPPGTAKSALVQSLASRIEGRVFDYLLTRFTEPNEIFGPFDIRQLREGNLVTNTEGMLPEATFVFLDELLNANSAILNSLLMVLNERVFRRGRETLSLPTLMVVGASNNLPEDEALGALFDRFLLRVNCTNVPEDELGSVLRAGWTLEKSEKPEPVVTVNELVNLQGLIRQVDFDNVISVYIETIQRLRAAGIMISDRRAVKLQRMLAASAVMCGRLEVEPSDMWVLRYIWDTVEQQEILNSLVTKAMESADEPSKGKAHPQSKTQAPPDPETMARDLESVELALGNPESTEAELAQTKDRLSILASRCQWVEDEGQRKFLDEKIQSLWGLVKKNS